MKETADRQLTTSQIEHLFDFVKEKHVDYVDIQYELVDHLASAIEVLMKEDMSLSFELALQKVYRRFPLTGFYHFVETKELALQTYWQKRMRSYIKLYFKLPKIVLFCLMTLVFWQLITLITFKAVFALYSVFLVGVALNQRKFLVQYYKGLRNNKHLVYRSYYQNVGMYVAVLLNTQVYFIYNLTQYSFHDLNALLFLGIKLLLSVFMTYIIIVGHALFFVFPGMLEKELSQKYAHLKLNLT